MDGASSLFILLKHGNLLFSPSDVQPFLFNWCCKSSPLCFRFACQWKRTHHTSLNTREHSCIPKPFSKQLHHLELRWKYHVQLAHNCFRAVHRNTKILLSKYVLRTQYKKHERSILLKKTLKILYQLIIHCQLLLCHNSSL